jgi:copper(I)-binding protein
MVLGNSTPRLAARPRFARPLAAFTLLMLVTSGPGDARAQVDAGGRTAATAVTVSDAWARATPPGARMGSIYLKLSSTNGDRLIGASVPRSVSGKTQIHETLVSRDAGGESMGMREVRSLELPAGRTVELAPGGFHLMLMDLKHPLKAGDRVRVTLRFEKSGTQTVTADVRGL